MGKAKTLEKNTKIPQKEDLQEALKVADPLEKAILLTGASSGLAANEICELKAGEFKRGYDPKTKITTLPLRRKKVGFDFITFLSPEASQAISDYLDYRSRTLDTNPAEKRQTSGKAIHEMLRDIIIGGQARSSFIVSQRISFCEAL